MLLWPSAGSKGGRTGRAIRPEITSLRPGDVLFRDKTTTTPLDGPDSLEKIVAELTAAGATQTEFSVIRGNKVGEAHMQLALEGE